MKIGVVSAGSWGTALAALLAGKKFDVKIWARESEVMTSINENNENILFMPGVKLPENLCACSDIKDAVYSKDVVVITTPSQFLRKSLIEISYMLSPGTFIVIASKGIEKGTLKLMHQIAEEILPSALHKNIFVISGPTLSLIHI